MDVEQDSRSLAFHFEKCFTVFPQNLSEIILICTCLESWCKAAFKCVKLISTCKMKASTSTAKSTTVTYDNHCASSKWLRKSLQYLLLYFKVLLWDSVELHKNEIELHSWRALVLQKQASTPTVIATWAIQAKIVLKKNYTNSKHK